MTDEELAKRTQARLTELSQRALQMHRTEKTRDFIVRTHNRWNYELASVEFTHEQMSPETLKAFEELDEAVSTLIEERGQDPDSILHWLDMYPSLVLNVHLRVPQPNTV